MADGTCAFPGCDGTRRKLGYCGSHYAQIRRGQELRPLAKRGIIRPCSVGGCQRHSHCRGLCLFHYNQLRDGRPFTPAPVPPPCSHVGCEREAISHGLCKVHGQRMKRTGTTDDRQQRVCSVTECGEVHIANGYCKDHYYRSKTYGTPFAERLRAKAGEGSTASGYRVFGGSDHPTACLSGYAREHRMVLYDAIGGGEHLCHWCQVVVSWDKSWPRDVDGLVADHLNGETLDNRIENLVPSCGDCNRARGYDAKLSIEARRSATP